MRTRLQISDRVLLTREKGKKTLETFVRWLYQEEEEAGIGIHSRITSLGAERVMTGVLSSEQIKNHIVRSRRLISSQLSTLSIKYIYSP